VAFLRKKLGEVFMPISSLSELIEMNGEVSVCVCVCADMLQQQQLVRRAFSPRFVVSCLPFTVLASL
jgi:hypothetical protein